MEFNIPIDVVCSDEYVVGEEHVARHIGRDVYVLSTPAMISFMEKTSLNCIQKHLPGEYTSVGYLVNVRHLNPVPLGALIKVESRILSSEGRKITLSVKVYYGDILVGEGLHERYIVNRDRFIEKVKKITKSSP